MKSMELGRYRHYKGKEYQVIGIAKHSETLQEFVVYQALYGDGELWIRPKDMFLENVRNGDEETQRFTHIGN